jgi:hypothetical protein
LTHASLRNDVFIGVFGRNGCEFTFLLGQWVVLFFATVGGAVPFWPGRGRPGGSAVVLVVGWAVGLSGGARCAKMGVGGRFAFGASESRGLVAVAFRVPV